MACNDFAAPRQEQKHQRQPETFHVLAANAALHEVAL